MRPACQLLASGDLILLPEAEVSRKLRKSFEESMSAGLLSLATDALEDETLPAELAFWREFGRDFLTHLCQSPPDREEGRWLPVAPPPPETLAARVLAAPPFPGLENLSPDLLLRHWQELDRFVCESVRSQGAGLESWLHGRHPLWRSVGRVTFHLAENKSSESHPFAFLATYTHRVSAQAKLQYLPVAKALKTYGSQKNTRVLEALLKPIHQAAQSSALARELLDSRRVFQVLAWTPEEAHRFIQDIELFEEAGLIVKVPDWWKGGRPSRPTVNINLDARETTSVGLNALLKFNVSLALDGEPLSPEEWEQIRNAQGGLISIKGKWVEVDREKLQQVLDQWQRAERAAGAGFSFLEGMRLLAGFRGLGGTGSADLDAAFETRGDWTQITASGALRERLRQLGDPRLSPDVLLPRDALRATLRPYQQAGLNWLWLTYSLGLGACLADDMGLGKTLQVIALLLHIKLKAQSTKLKTTPSSKLQTPSSPLPTPSLLVVPASLIGNWRKEIERFAPSLRVCYAHPSQTRPLCPLPDLSGFDAVITTYSMLRRLPELARQTWNLLILDEAQAIKNPGSQQTKTVKSLSAVRRLALTGTPIENNITDLWSLFDFLNPGLLGSASRFASAVKVLASDAERGFQPLRRLVSPYLLRRLKSDRSIIADLPGKVEMRTDCGLSKDQATLYQKSVRELAAQLREQSDPGSIERKGLVLTYLMRFKQICDHPALWTGSGNFDPKSSGKLKRLAELADTMHLRGEKVLVFSQFREMTAPLAGHLETVFGRPGLILHGGTAVSLRQKLVDQFQDPAGPPFFVISLKAGGTGLNLTAASHVVHFDRWWNPAVEDQATDRAYRIGQEKRVLVHKFVCPGTVEERIDKLISEKKELAAEIIGGQPGAESLLTRMSDEELLQFVSLDLESATL